MLRRAHVLCLCDPRLKAAEDVSHVHWREEARRDDAENLLQMHLVYTFSFVVVLVTLIATLSSLLSLEQSLFTTYQSVTWSSRIIVARRLSCSSQIIDQHSETPFHSRASSRELASCCWYENHSFHPLLFGNVSILQKSINYCLQNTLSSQWFEN